MTDRELDALVAGKVLRLKTITATAVRPMTWNGCRVSGGVYLDTGKKSTWGRNVKDIPAHSTSFADAWLVVEEMARRGYRMELATRSPDGKLALVGFFRFGEPGGPGEQSAPPARAICLAALRALGVEVPA